MFHWCVHSTIKNGMSHWFYTNTYAIDNDLENWRGCKIRLILCADVIEYGNL